MIEAISPRRTEIDTSSTARTPPNRFETAVAARSSSSAGFSNRAPPKEFGRHMRQRYGWHDADAIKRMQPVTWLTGLSLGRGSALLPLTGRRGTITAEQPRGPGDERRRYRRFAGDAADRISRQRQADGAAPPACRPLLFLYGGPRQRGRLDAVEGDSTLARFAEAARQVAVADALVVSKTDLAPFGPALAERLDALNPSAERILGAELEDPATALFSPSKRPHLNPPPLAGEGVIAPTATTLPRMRGREVRGGAEDGWGLGGESHAHSHGIAVFAVTLKGAISRFDFARALGGLARDRGSDLLRVKGLVEFADRPGRPAVVQAAQHAMFTPEWLDRWPDPDHRSRLLLIVHDIRPEEILGHFAFAPPALAGEPA